ncbi:MAG: peptidylprolyl isomerase [Pseudomonadota bacterium]
MFASLTSALARGSPLRARLGGALREPLVQFALIGLAIFALDRATEAPPVDPNRIVIDTSVQRELSDLYLNAHGTRPSRAKLEELIEVYATDEVLFREARALRLDEGDEVLRARLTTRMRTMLLSGITVEDPDEATLRAWHAERAADFREPARLSFQIVPLDAPDEAAARQMATDLNDGTADPAVDFPHAVPVVDRPEPQLRRIVGDAFVDAVIAGAPGVWQAVPSPRGWQVTAFGTRQTSATPPFEDVADRVREAWQEAERNARARTDLEALKARYALERTALDPAFYAPPDAGRQPGDGVDAASHGSSAAPAIAAPDSAEPFSAAPAIAAPGSAAPDGAVSQ